MKTDLIGWLVVWLPFFIFPYIGLLIIPIDFHIFQRGKPTTTSRDDDHPGLMVYAEKLQKYTDTYWFLTAGNGVFFCLLYIEI